MSSKNIQTIIIYYKSNEIFTTTWKRIFERIVLYYIWNTIRASPRLVSQLQDFFLIVDRLNIVLETSPPSWILSSLSTAKGTPTHFHITLFTSDIIIERHWRGRISRTVGEKFYEEVKKEKKPEDVLPVISFSNYTLVHVYRYGIFFVGVASWPSLNS